MYIHVHTSLCMYWVSLERYTRSRLQWLPPRKGAMWLGVRETFYWISLWTLWILYHWLNAHLKKNIKPHQLPFRGQSCHRVSRHKEHGPWFPLTSKGAHHYTGGITAWLEPKARVGRKQSWEPNTPQVSALAHRCLPWGFQRFREPHSLILILAIRPLRVTMLGRFRSPSSSAA